MSIIYVDIEHSRVATDLVAGVSHRTRLDAARNRLAAASGEECDLVHYMDVTIGHIRFLNPSAIVVSGNTADWIEYDFTSLAGLLETIRAAPAPILGICGGHQLIGYAHGARWGQLGRVPDGAIDQDPLFAPGLRTERGFRPIDVDTSCALFQGLNAAPVVYQSHYWQLTETPVGFDLCASSAACPIQALSRTDRPVFGVQFHPERYDESHRDGEAMLRNFFNVARASATSRISSTVSVP